nr:MAG TPA: hypothetical protein [Caudoviricetes sp.]
MDPLISAGARAVPRARAGRPRRAGGGRAGQGGRLVAALAAVLCARAGEQAGRAGTCCRCGSGRRRGLLCYGSGRRAA